MFSHLTVGTNQIKAAVAFYDQVFAALGIVRGHIDLDVGYCGYKDPNGGPEFWVLNPLNQQAATVGNGITIGFSAKTRAQVDAFYDAAITAGGTDEGKPGLRPQYHEHCYAAYVRDLDGNKLCCICHTPE